MNKRILILVVAALYLIPGMAQAKRWSILNERSALSFTAIYNKEPVNGSFPNFTGDIQFDPEAPEKSHIAISVELGAVKSDMADAQTSLPGDEFFAAAKFPVARFETARIAKTGEKQFEAEAKLTIRDKTVDVRLPFSLEIYKGDGADEGKEFARASGSVTLKRLDFGIGAGEWAATEIIADEVTVNVQLQAVAGE